MHNNPADGKRIKSVINRIIPVMLLVTSFCMNADAQYAQPFYPYPEQEQLPAHAPQKKDERRPFFKNVFGMGGVAAGQEYLVSVKGSFIKPFRIGSNKGSRSKFGFYPVCAYAGAEAGLMGLFALWGGIGVCGGFAAGPVTIDNSVTCFGIMGNEGAGGGHITSNPKLGLKFGPVWMKAGPSFLLTSESATGNWLQIGQTKMNFELCFYWPGQQK